MAANGSPVLVIGGSGFIGRNVVAQLATSGVHVTATYHHDATFAAWAAQWPNVTALHFDATRDPAHLEEFEICLYMAGNANHTWALEHPQEDLRMNTAAILHTLSGFHGRLVYLSSGAVYYGLVGQVGPTTPVHPVFPYAISKYASELYIQHLAHTGQLEGYTLIRLYYAYGPYEPSRRLIPTLIRKLLVENATTFTLNGDGQTLMAPLYVGDVAQALCQALSQPALNRAVDLCPAQPITLQALVEQTAAALQRPLQLSYRPTREESLRFWSTDDEARQFLGLENPLPLTDGVTRYVEWLHQTAPFTFGEKQDG